MTRRTFLKRTVAASPLAVYANAVRAGLLLGVLVGIVVLVIGAIVIYYIVKKCKNSKPKELPPEDDDGAIGYILGHAGVLYTQEPACEAETSFVNVGSLFKTLEITVDPTNKVTMFILDETMAAEQSERAIIQMGLSPTENSSSFGHLPIDQENSPISIDNTLGVPHVSIAGPERRKLALMVSVDLVSWTTLVTATIPVSHTFKFYDVVDISIGTGRYYRSAPLPI